MRYKQVQSHCTNVHIFHGLLYMNMQIANCIPFTRNCCYIELVKAWFPTTSASLLKTSELTIYAIRFMTDTALKRSPMHADSCGTRTSSNGSRPIYGRASASNHPSIACHVKVDALVRKSTRFDDLFDG